jgi:hypothetical protein
LGGGGYQPDGLEQRVSELAETQAKRKSRDRAGRWPMDGSAQFVCEVYVANGIGCAGVDGSLDRWIISAKNDQPRKVLDVNPGHPLLAIAQFAAQPQTENWQ